MGTPMAGESSGRFEPLLDLLKRSAVIILDREGKPEAMGFLASPYHVITYLTPALQGGEETCSFSWNRRAFAGRLSGVRIGADGLAVIRTEERIGEAGVWMRRFSPKSRQGSPRLLRRDSLTLRTVPTSFEYEDCWPDISLLRSPDYRMTLETRALWGGPVLDVASGEVVGVVAEVEQDGLRMVNLGQLAEAGEEVFADLWREQAAFHASAPAWSRACDELRPGLMAPMEWPVRGMLWERAADVFGTIARLSPPPPPVSELRARVAKVDGSQPPIADAVTGPDACRSAQDLAREYAETNNKSGHRWSRLAILCAVLTRCYPDRSAAREELKDAVSGLVTTALRKDLYDRVDKVLPAIGYLGAVITPTSAHGVASGQRGSEIYEVRFLQGGDTYEPDGPAEKLTLRQIAVAANRRAMLMSERNGTDGTELPILELFVERPLLGRRLRELCKNPATGTGPLIDDYLPVVVRDLSRVTSEPEDRGWRELWNRKWKWLVEDKPLTRHGVARSCCLPGPDNGDHLGDTPGDDKHFALVLAREPKQDDDQMTGDMHRALKGGYPLIVWPSDDSPCDAAASGACADLVTRIRGLVMPGPVDAPKLARTLKNVTWGAPGGRRVVAVLDDPTRRLTPDKLTTPGTDDRHGIRETL